MRGDFFVSCRGDDKGTAGVFVYFKYLAGVVVVEGVAGFRKADDLIFYRYEMKQNNRG